jgi:hypothetical protein
VGVVSLFPACEFCLRKGDWRTLPVSDPPGDRVPARNVDCGVLLATAGKWCVPWDKRIRTILADVSGYADR